MPMERRSDRWLSVALSVLFHGALLALIGMGWWHFHRPTPAVPQLAIDATVVDGRALAKAQAARAAAQHPTPPQTTPPPPPAPPAQQTVVPPPPTVTPPEQTGPPAPPKPTPEQLQQAEAERIAREQAEEKAKAEAEREAEEAARERKQEAQREAQQARREAQQRQEAKRQQEAEARRRAEAKRQQEQKAAEAKRLAEQKAAEAKAAQKAAEDKRRAEAAALAETEADLRRGIDAEQRAAAANGAVATWKQQIEARLRQNWIRPPSARAGIDCVLTVTQVPGGQVVNATVGSCNGDTAVQESIIDAAYRASPLPAPPDPALFQRVLIIHFIPSD